MEGRNTQIAPRGKRQMTIANDTRARAMEVLHRRFGAADWDMAPGISARKSTIFCLSSPSAGVTAALKVYDQTLRPGRGPALQVAALERFQPLLASNGDGFDLPEIYGWFPENGAVVMEWVAAQQLEQVLVRAAVSPRSHWDAVALAGRWLRQFHNASGFTDAAFDPTRYHLMLENRITNHPAALDVLQQERLWVTGYQRFQRSGRALEGARVRTAITHGDFTSTNLLIGRGRVTGIDLWAERPAPIADDLARMFVYLAMGDPLPLAARFGPVALERRRAMRALFEGYGPDMSPDGPVWRHIVLFEALARWLALSARLVRRGNLTERWKAAGLRRLIASLLRRQ
jgi:aminoglycoside phosphotransferase (APT) family kinase protein